MADRNERLISRLNDLIEFNHDAIEAYQAAIERIQCASTRRSLMGFRKDHDQHTRSLSRHVRELGGSPAQGPDMLRHLTHGRVVIADLVDGDRAILIAMRANEEMTTRRYERVLATEAGMPPSVCDSLQAHLRDEYRHLDWIRARIDEIADAEKAA